MENQSFKYILVRQGIVYDDILAMKNTHEECEECFWNHYNHILNNKYRSYDNDVDGWPSFCVIKVPATFDFACGFAAGWDDISTKINYEPIKD